MNIHLQIPPKLSAELVHAASERGTGVEDVLLSGARLLLEESQREPRADSAAG